MPTRRGGRSGRRAAVHRTRSRFVRRGTCVGRRRAHRAVPHARRAQIDGNGVLDAADLELLSAMGDAVKVLSQVPLRGSPGVLAARGDLNGDGNVDDADVQELRLYLECKQVVQQNQCNEVCRGQCVDAQAAGKAGVEWCGVVPGVDLDGDVCFPCWPAALGKLQSTTTTPAPTTLPCTCPSDTECKMYAPSGRSKSGACTCSITLRAEGTTCTAAGDAAEGRCDSSGQCTVWPSVTVRRGDADGDGIVSRCDALMIQEAIDEGRQVSGSRLRAFDVDGSGQIGGDDIKALSQGGMALMGASRCDARPSSDSDAACSPGDVDGNGMVDEADLVVLKELLTAEARDAALALVPLAARRGGSAEKFSAADVNMDRDVDLFDYSALKSMLAPCYAERGAARLNFFAVAGEAMLGAVERYRCGAACKVGTTEHCGAAASAYGSGKTFCGAMPITDECECWDGSRGTLADEEAPPTEAPAKPTIVYYNTLRYSLLEADPDLENELVTAVARRMGVPATEVTPGPTSSGTTLVVLRVPLPPPEDGDFDTLISNDTALRGYASTEQQLQESVT